MSTVNTSSDVLGLVSKESTLTMPLSAERLIHKHEGNTWVSDRFIEEADRDVELYEAIHIFVLNKATGKELKDFYWWTPWADQTTSKMWPRRVAWNVWLSEYIDVGEPIEGTSRYPFRLPGGTEGFERMSERNRLWFKGEENRIFTTLPQKSNWTKYLTLNKVTLAEDTKIKIDVKHAAFPDAYESHTFSPSPTRLAAAEWHEDFFKLISTKSIRIKAGNWNDAVKLAFDKHLTALWIPQGSELEIIISSSGSAATAELEAVPDTVPDLVFRLAGGLVSVPGTPLPDMTGFEWDELGIPEHSWVSPGYLLADRDLEAGEKLYAWLIRLEDGEPLEVITFVVEKENKSRADWPQAFARYINQQAKQMRAGGWDDEGEFTALSGTSTPEAFEGLGLVGQSRLNRLWHYSRDNRAFSTAAFRNNWVQTLTLGGADLTAETTLWVQVRDITSQYLYETHIFSPAPNRLGSAEWSKDLCKKINQDGKMLRAGVMDDVTGCITPGNNKNTLWIPQCSDLAVTLMPVTWWTQQSVTADQDLEEDQSIYTYVWDEYSNAELIQPHCFTPASSEERKKQNWVGAWAKALNASALSPYVCLGTSGKRLGGVANGALTASIWQVGAPLRVFTTEPSARNWTEHTLVLDKLYEDNDSKVQIDIINKSTGYTCASEIFGVDNKTVIDRQTWIAALHANVIKKSGGIFKIMIAKPHDPKAITTPPTAYINPRLLLPRESRLLLRTSQVLQTQHHVQSLDVDDNKCYYSLHVHDSLLTLASTAIVLQQLFRAQSFRRIPLNSHLFMHQSQGLSIDFTSPSQIISVISEEMKATLTQIKNNFYGYALTGAPKSHEIPRYINNLLKSLADSMPIICNPIKIQNGEAQAHMQEKTADPILLENFIFESAGMLKDRHSPEIPKLIDQYIEIYQNNYRLPPAREMDVIQQLRRRAVITHVLRNPADLNTKFIIPTSNRICITQHHVQADLPTANLIARLRPVDAANGVRLTYGMFFRNYGSVEHDLHFPETYPTNSTARLERGISTSENIWQKRDYMVLTPPDKDEGPTPSSPLCEDYGNTFRSEVFDVSGLNSTGVDPRTGLFNAHYPVAKLTGLDGKGPTCDLTLHYSPLRANESGLGDGWAFNFSWYDSRPRLLTLNNGQTIQFSEAELASLKKGQSVSQLGYSITATAATSSSELESIEILMPSGSKETLAKASGDSSEHNEAFVKTVIEKLKEAQRKIPEFIASTHPLKDETWYQNAILIFMSCVPGMRGVALETKTEKQRAVENWEAYWEKRRPELLNRVKSEIDYWSRPELQYVPSKITSDFGGALIFNWKREGGQYLLETVKTTDEVLLLSAAYTPAKAPTETAGIQSTATFTIWPDTPDAYIVILHLNNYLLKTIVRSNTENITAQTVEYGYSPDPTLDRVLTSILESDGSLEKVFYEAGGMRFPTIDGAEKFALPRVTTHIVSPGVNATPLRTDWEYSENNYLGRGDENTAAYAFPMSAHYYGNKYRYWSSEAAYLGNSIKRTWNAFHLQTEEVETSPEGASKTTFWKYPEAGLRTDPAFGLPLAINTTYLDVSPATSEDAKS